MVSSYSDRLIVSSGKLTDAYGKDHPLALSAGGWPAAIREMKAQDIRRFHADNYHLGNIGMVASFPRRCPLGDGLRPPRPDSNRLEPTRPQLNAFSSPPWTLPAPKPPPAGQIELVSTRKERTKPGG